MSDYFYLYWDFVTGNLDDKKVFKGHKLYELKCNVDEDGYFDEYHETGIFRKIGQSKRLMYTKYQILKEIKNITKSTGPGPDLDCYANKNDIKDYYVIIMCKNNSKVEKAIRQLDFKVMKTPQE